MASFFDTKIQFLKGIGPRGAQLLNTELAIFTYGDLLMHLPFRHEDRSQFTTLAQVDTEASFAQFKGHIRLKEMLGDKFKRRLVAHFNDGTGEAELVWFKGAEWVEKHLRTGEEVIVSGKPTFFNGRVSLAHPDVEPLTHANARGSGWVPVYHVTEKLRKSRFDSGTLAKLLRELVAQARPHITENLPEALMHELGLIGRADALCGYHFPKTQNELSRCTARLKFEELFFAQLRLLKLKNQRKNSYPGHLLNKVPTLTKFYNNHLPFELTGAQKRVIKEIYADFCSGKQMNRLLQGDVGSGKTIVAFICMLMAIDNGRQACLMAPTEILAEQHYKGLKEFADMLGLRIEMIAGSTRQSVRKVLLPDVAAGEVHILVGTHALLEDPVQFNNLGFCVIDEQHKFGVDQRMKLWRKNRDMPPHILVMSATPIPRTLAMTFYGDLDVSVIDELPVGRKPIQTVHRYESKRLEVFGFLRKELDKGRQVYIVYPLIEESEVMDLNNLQAGYESICRAFPDIPVSAVHGKMKAADKELEMRRFVKGLTRIMVATTVIEVGVNVPNASLMVIENAERFGLAQLHQLRGRVGRGAEQSYCILMTGEKVGHLSRQRIKALCTTNNGFEIAELDLKLRGPGDLTGTRQSGVLDLVVANLATDGTILQEARHRALELLDIDPELTQPEHAATFRFLDFLEKRTPDRSMVS